MATVQDIVNRVRSAIDELSVTTGSDFIDTTGDEGNLVQLIKDKIEYALAFVLEHAPLDKFDDDSLQTLDAATIANSFSINGSTLVGRLALPDNVLRIIEARLSSWSYYPIPVPDSSPIYLMQQDQYAMGSYDRPVNIYTFDGSKRYLEMYCAKTTSDTLKFTYIAKPSINTSSLNNPVNVPSRLEGALVYQVAGLTLEAFREESARDMFTIARGYLDISVENDNGQ